MVSHFMGWSCEIRPQPPSTRLQIFLNKIQFLIRLVMVHHLGFILIPFVLVFLNVIASEERSFRLAASSNSTLYVLAYSWEAEFCYGQSYPGCANPQSYWKTDFTLHGLWPQYATGGYPQYCTTEPFDPAIPNEIGYSTMTEYWPNVQQAEGTSEYDDFWDHEWTKHGAHFMQ
jgi:ribonuclease I